MTEYHEIFIEHQLDQMPNFDYDPKKSMRHWRKIYGFAVPTDEIIQKIIQLAEGEPIVEIGAGTGYWASLLHAAGANIDAYDISPPRLNKNQYKFEREWMHVKRGGPRAIKDRHKTLFLCWPNYQSKMDLICYKRFQGDRVIYIGEGWEGCTGSDAGHEYLFKNFDYEIIEGLPRMWGLWDDLYFCRRKK